MPLQKGCKNDENNIQKLNYELLIASKEGNVKKTKELLARGADPSYWNISIGFPLFLALLLPDPFPMVEVLLKAGAKINGFHENPRRYFSPNPIEAFNYALDRAVRDNNGELLSLFLQYGGDPNKPDETENVDYDGKASIYPIYIAVEGNSEFCTQALLSFGANINSWTHKHKQLTRKIVTETPLHVAVSKGTLRMVDLLLNSGADVNASRSGIIRTPLHIAILRESIPIIELLLAAGADKSIPYSNAFKEMQTLDLARTKEIKQLLLMNFAVWSPSTHHCYPSNIRKAIKTFLLCIYKQKRFLPKDIFSLICTWIAKSKLVTVSANNHFDPNK